MSKMITATGMALLSIGIVATVQAQPVSNAGQVTLAEAAPVDASTAARRKGPKVKVKEISTRVANPPATTDPVTPTQTGAPVAPIDAPEAARRKGPKVKVKEAMDTSRIATPTPTEPTTSTPIAPIDAPDAARTGRPKERDKEISTRVAEPAPATEPVAQPTERRRKGPKERDDPVLDTSRTGGRPKERDDDARDTSRTGRPKERDDSPHNRTSLLLPALGGAAAIAAIIVATSGNDRPTSP
jgi:hypothetical protein